MQHSGQPSRRTPARIWCKPAWREDVGGAAWVVLAEGQPSGGNSMEDACTAAGENVGATSGRPAMCQGPAEVAATLVHSPLALTVPCWLHCLQLLPRVGAVEHLAHLPRLLKKPRLHTAHACRGGAASSTLKHVARGASCLCASRAGGRHALP